MDDVLELLNELEAIIDESKSIPFSNKVSVDKDDIYDLIEQIKHKLPAQMKQSKWVVEEREKILSNARKEGDDIITEAHGQAEEIIKEAYVQVEKLVQEDEITQRAYEQANEIMENCKNTAKEIRLGAREYADEVLANTEAQLNEMMNSIRAEAERSEEYIKNVLDVIYENRQELKVPKK